MAHAGEGFLVREARLAQRHLLQSDEDLSQRMPMRFSSSTGIERQALSCSSASASSPAPSSCACRRGACCAMICRKDFSSWAAV